MEDSMQIFSIGLIIAFIFVIIILSNAIRVLREYERGVIFRLGRLIGAKGPGIIFLVPIVDRMVKVSLRTVVLDVPPQDVITKDNVSIKVNAVVYFRVVQPEKCIVEVENFLFATSQLSQTTLRSILGQSELDEFQASQKLSEAANVISKNPVALQLRFLQTLTEIAVDKNSTILFPVPIDLLEPFINRNKKD